MKFLKFWWKHGLRTILLVAAALGGWGWLSGYVHWWIYANRVGENHLTAFLETVVIFWFAIPLFASAIGIFVLAPVLEYFGRLWRNYKEEEDNGA